MITVNNIHNFFNKLCEEAEYEPHEGQWFFRNGGACCSCTDVAIRVAKAFTGRVVGYYSNSNPSAFIGSNFCEGHDFAIVSDRYIVDIWAYKVAKIISKPVFDLDDACDHEQVKILYGDSCKWENVPYETINLPSGN